MSKYENYDRISQTYDKTRTAVGMSIILGVLHQQSKPIDELVVLDAGCGTGNYSVELDQKVGRLVCGDFSQGMLNKARIKLTKNEDVNRNFVRMDVSDIPFRESSLDVIMCNQCLHHIDEPYTNFKNLRKFFVKAHSVLRDDGVLLINSITHRQMRDGVWWAELISPAIEKMTPRFTSDDEFEEILAESGFYIEHRVVPAGEIIQSNGYFDKFSLFDEQFRNGDSHFSLLSSDELQRMLEILKGYEAEGILQKYIDARDRLRKDVGQFTIFVIKKYKDNIKE